MDAKGVIFLSKRNHERHRLGHKFNTICFIEVLIAYFSGHHFSLISYYNVNSNIRKYP